MSSGVAPAPGAPHEPPPYQRPGASGSPGSNDPGPRSSQWVWARRAYLVNVVAQVGIVITGGLVRVTGSGLGCPSWPQCVPGSFTPVLRQPQGYHKYVEFGNRMLTGVVGLSAISVLLATVLLVLAGLAGRRRLAVAAAPLGLVVVQAVLGGITVRTHLSPATVAAHFLVSMVLVATSSWLLLTAAGRPPARVEVRPELRLLAAGIAVVAAVVLVLGTVVTGSGPHSGDANAPARFGFDPSAVAWLHADAVWLFLGLVLALLLAVRLTTGGRPDAARLGGRARALLGVTLLQGLIGYVQYATGLPVLAVVLHMLGACLLVVAVTAVVAEVGLKP